MSYRIQDSFRPASERRALVLKSHRYCYHQRFEGYMLGYLIPPYEVEFLFSDIEETD